MTICVAPPGARATAAITGLPTAPMLAQAERLLLGARLTLAMLAAGLLLVALAWEYLVPNGSAVATLVAGAAAALVAVPVLVAAWQSLRAPSLHGVTDRLVALALIAAWASGDLMTAAVLPIVMTVAHVLEERSLLGSREAILALSRLTETQARRLRGGSVELVPSTALRPGDRIELRAGDRVPADGIVRAGTASLDMASLTGEAMPVDVEPGQTTLLGAITTNGRLEVEVIRTGADTTFGRIIDLMQAAEEAKPPVTRLLESYAGRYLSVVLLVAGGTWFASGNLEATLAVLVASCPCALVLAAPGAAIAAIAVAARHGILIKGAAFLESLAEVRAVVFDKTGTLTTGEMSLAGVAPVADAAGDDVLRVAAGLGAASSHPVSRAAVRAAPTGGCVAVTELREEGGFGLTGRCDGVSVAFGRPALFARLGIAVPAAPAHDGPLGGVSRDGVFLGWLLFSDTPRAEAGAALADLRALGLSRQVLLTGDRAAVAQRIGAELAMSEVCAEMLPDQKMQRVRQETRDGFHPLVVGDGINDSLALRAGAVGIAMGAQGTDVALASADLVLISSDLRRIGTAIRLSRRCRRTIHTNVGIGLGWTLVLVVLAACGVLGAQGAVIAALLHNLSTFLGLANSGRLLLFDETGRAVAGEG